MNLLTLQEELMKFYNSNEKNVMHDIGYLQGLEGVVPAALQEALGEHPILGTYSAHLSEPATEETLPRHPEIVRTDSGGRCTRKTMTVYNSWADVEVDTTRCVVVPLPPIFMISRPGNLQEYWSNAYRLDEFVDRFKENRRASAPIWFSKSTKEPYPSIEHALISTMVLVSPDAVKMSRLYV
jgi:hypothetical protein